MLTLLIINPDAFETAVYAKALDAFMSERVNQEYGNDTSRSTLDVDVKGNYSLHWELWISGSKVTERSIPLVLDASNPAMPIAPKLRTNTKQNVAEANSALFADTGIASDWASEVGRLHLGVYVVDGETASNILDTVSNS